MNRDLGAYRPPTCAKCDSVGTIVEMRLCCKVQRWNALGGMWDIADLRKPPRIKRPGTRHRSTRH